MRRSHAIASSEPDTILAMTDAIPPHSARSVADIIHAPSIGRQWLVAVTFEEAVLPAPASGSFRCLNGASLVVHLRRLE